MNNNNIIMLKVKIRRATSSRTRDLNVPILYKENCSTNKEKFITINANTIRVEVTNDINYKPTDFISRDIMYVGNNQRKNLRLAMDIEYDAELRNIQMESKSVVSDKLEIISVRQYDGKLVETSHIELLSLAKEQLKDIILIPNFVYHIDHPKSGTILDISLTLDKPVYYNGGDFTIKEIELSRTAAKNVILLDSYAQDLSIFKNDFNLQKLGIGGLKKECQEFFRRALCSRGCHPDLIKELKINHCKGVILYGPPGTGKTLIARQLAKIMNSHPPKIVSGPEILNKFIGESESNLRNLFSDAEQEYKEKGEFSKLHVVIFDEFDSIARKRSSSDSSGSQVASNLVNQLLAKMDGVEILNNILIIGLTNRIDLLDKALLRPGRFEVCIEIGIPEAADRLEILQIYLEQLTNKGLFQNAGLTLEELVTMTENFTGAEIAGMVRNVTSYAIEREVSAKQNQKNKEESLKSWDNLKIEKNDFINSIKSINQTKSHHGKLLDILLSDTTLEWSFEVNTQLDNLRKMIKSYLHSNTQEYHGQSFKILIVGGKRKGKSTMAADLSKEIAIKNVIYSSNFDLLGKQDSQKALFLKELYQDAIIPHESIIILDDIDQMIELAYKNNYQIYSNTILQTFKTLFSTPTSSKLIFITTAISKDQIECIELLDSFHSVVEIS